MSISFFIQIHSKFEIELFKVASKVRFVCKVTDFYFILAVRPNLKVPTSSLKTNPTFAEGETTHPPKPQSTHLKPETQPDPDSFLSGRKRLPKAQHNSISQAYICPALNSIQDAHRILYFKTSSIMQLKSLLLTSFCILALVHCKNSDKGNAAATGLPQLGKATLDEVVQALTLEEKVSLVLGMGFHIPGMPAGILPPMDSVDAAVPEKVLGAAGRTHAVPRLGIPSLTLADGPAGVRIAPTRGTDSTHTYYATAFPIGTLLASTWDVDLVQQMGGAFGEEVRDYGVDVLLGPAMNIHRNALGGRNFEYYSEDPLVSGSIAAAVINGIQSKGVGTSVKHFAGNNHEFNRTKMNVQVSERALREIYLRNFQIALQKCDPWTIMSSYNLINGTYTSQDRALLDTFLRQEAQFKGVVMTDWFAGNDAVAQMNAGNDLLMPGTLAQKAQLFEGAQTSALKMKLLDENVKRILELVLKSPTFLGQSVSNTPDLKAHAQVSRQVASEGMILLKNEAALPMPSAKNVALFGNGSYSLIAGGTGSGDVNKKYMVSLDAGLTNANYTVHGPLAQTYTQYVATAQAKLLPVAPFMPKTAITEMAIDAALATKMAAENDIAVFTIGKHSGEFADRDLERDFYLSSAEKAAMDVVSKAFRAKGKKMVVVLNIGGTIETASWRDKADAILLAWQAGQESGNAIADILKGTVNPSGRLATTFPLAYKDESSSKNFPGKVTQVLPNKKMIDGDPTEITYAEGIYVGYRYFNTFNVKPAYAFGYGLSYTTFVYSALTLSSSTFTDRIKVSVTVANTGKVPGKEVVQLYLAAPTGSLHKPESELRAFGKSKFLAPSESQTLTFELSAADLCSFHPGLSAWMADAGVYTVKVGSSALDIKEKATFTLAQAKEMGKLPQILLPKSPIAEMKK
jgi:beta-glucosidase